jgi:sugar phosphate permease
VDKQEIHRVLRFRWLIFAILALAYFFVYFHRLSLSVVANDLAIDFKTSASVLGMLGSIYFYCYAFMQIPAGLLSDSIGPRKIVTVFLLLASAGSICFGLAPTIAVAFVSRIMVGFGVAMVFIPTMKILSQWFRPQEFAMMAGILNAVGGAGVLAATWLLALMSARFGWRLSFELIGFLTFFIACLAWIIVSDRPHDKNWPSIDEIDKHVTAEPTQKIPLWQGMRQVIAEKHFWPIAIWFFFDCGVFFGFGALWGGPYLIHVYGFNRAQAGAILSMIAWGMIIGSPLLGYLSDKVVKSRKIPFIACASLLVLIFLLLNLFPDNLSPEVLYIIFFLFSICSSSIVIIGFTTTKELFPVEIAGTSVGTVNFFPFLGGAVFMPLLGRVLDGHPKSDTGSYPLEGYAAVLLILLGASLIAMLCTLAIKETYRR